MPDLFISYAHADVDFVRRLNTCLEAHGKDAWIDWDSIPPSAEWLREIEAGIAASHAFVFVISPDSLASKVCTIELGVAIDQHKRIVPLLLREPPDGRLPASLAASQWISFESRRQAVGEARTRQEPFDSAVQTLVTTLDTDLDRHRLHTRLLVRAGEWEQRERDPGRLLRGSDLRDAEAFLEDARTLPQPTELEREYIAASRRAAARRQRALLIAVSSALVIAAGLAVYALVQRALAVGRQQLALSRALTAESLAALGSDPQLSILLAREAVHHDQTPEAEIALRRALGANQLRALAPAAGTVLGLAYSPNGQVLATASTDHLVRLWSADGERLLHVLRGHTAAVTDVSFDATGAELVTASSDRTARVWLAASGAPVGRPLLAPAGLAQAALIDADAAVVALGEDGEVFAWNAHTGRLLSVLNAPRGDRAVTMAVNPGRELVAVGYASGAIRMWDPARGKLVTLRTPEVALADAARADERLPADQAQSSAVEPPRVRSVAFSPNGRLVAAGDESGSTLVYSIGGRLLSILYGSLGVNRQDFAVYDAANSLAFSPNSRMLAVAGALGSVRLWDLATHSAKVLAGTAPVKAVAFSSDGALVATGSEDGLASVWNAASGEPLATLAGSRGSIVDVAFDPSGNLLASTATGEYDARVWRALPGDLLSQVAEPELHAFDLLAGGTRVLTVGSGEVELWNTLDGSLVVQRSFGNATSNEQISPDGRYAALSAPDAVRVIDTQTLGGKRDTPMRDPTGRRVDYNGGLAISTDARRVVSGSTTGTAYEWNGTTGALEQTLSGSPDEGSSQTVSAQISANGARVLTIGEERASHLYHATLWDARTGEREHSISLPPGELTTNATLSPNGAFVATVGEAAADNGPALYDTQTGHKLFGLSSRYGITSASFSRDARLLVTADEDGTVTIWNTHGGGHRTLSSLTDFAVNDAEFDPSGRLVVVATSTSRTSERGQALIYDVATGALLATLESGTVPLTQASFSSVDGPLATLDADRRLDFWACEVCGSLGDVLDVAERVLLRGLSASEASAYGVTPQR
jgi:WD40 repeat protein